MPKFQELEPKSAAGQPTFSGPTDLIAKRYQVQKRLGRGSFGTIYLVHDTKATEEEKVKVLKEVPVGDLDPDQTVQAHTEAQLLAQLHHPTILKFHTSFLEKDVFCIITEYCEDGDLDCKMEEFRQAGKSLAESQVVEWFVQMLLGVHYMHQRQILHRDLKAKNIFLKKNIVKIGDFGVSRLLAGSCDLATTFTGTPYYMSPEALSHQGYNSKSDIWSLGCILYEMCCLEHAFGGQSFLSVVMKIMEGPTPSLPPTYSKELDTILQQMLSKDPTLRLSAAEVLKMCYIEEKMQSLKLKFCGTTQREKTFKCEQNTSQIENALQKVHLQTLRELSEIQKMTPRERMRLRKQQAADEHACKLKRLAEEKYHENSLRMQELRYRHFQKVSVDFLNESTDAEDPHIPPVIGQDGCSPEQPKAVDGEGPDGLPVSELVNNEIPEDPGTAEAYYDEDVFESFSDEEDKLQANETLTSGQDSDLEAMMKYMENVLESASESATVFEAGCEHLLSTTVTDRSAAEARVQRMRESIQGKLGAAVFQRAYEYLKQARQQQESEAQVWAVLSKLVGRPSDCFEVDQLLYYEEQLLHVEEGHT